MSHKMLRTPELTYGFGCLKELKGILARVGAQRVLVVTSPELRQLGLLQSCLNSIGEAPAIDCKVMAEVQPDPNLNTLNAICEIGRNQGSDFIVALGGGSPIDAAKASAAMLGGGLDFDELLDAQNIKKVLPLLAIPTTAGTGSEVTPVAVITDDRDLVKKGVVSDLLIPDFALLDAELTLGLPPSQTAFTGLDAFSHALEASFSLGGHELTDFYAEKALTLIRDHLVLAYQDGRNQKARESMQLAAYYAGLAFANAGVTAAHAFAYPLGARYHLPHGLLVSLMLPSVVEYSWSAQTQKAERLARLLTQDLNAQPQDLISYLVKLCRDLNVKLGLAEYGVKEEEIEPMAESVLGITRLLKNNPRPITSIKETRSIYKRAYRYV